MSKLIILVDASGILHPCFHGYRTSRPGWVGDVGSPGNNEKQMDVAAVFGYLHRCRRMAQEFSYDEIIHVLDPEGGSAHRFGLYPDYKGNRSPTHPALTAQKGILQHALEAFGQTCIKVPFVESDDVIATLARRYAAQGHAVLVVSQDKDLMQLVSDGAVTLARYMDSGPNAKQFVFYEEKDVLAEFGVRPDQVADFLALCGDTSDNIPGVKGVAEKTAAKLLAQHGTLAALMTNAETVPGALGRNLVATMADLPLYKNLTTVLDALTFPDPVAKPACQDALAWARRAGVSESFWPDDLVGDLLDGPSVSPTPSSPSP